MCRAAGRRLHSPHEFVPSPAAVSQAPDLTATARAAARRVQAIDVVRGLALDAGGF